LNLIWTTAQTVNLGVTWINNAVPVLKTIVNSTPDDKLNLELNRLWVILSHHSSGTSKKTFEHWLNNYNNKQFADKNGKPYSFPDLSG